MQNNANNDLKIRKFVVIFFCSKAAKIQLDVDLLLNILCLQTRFEMYFILKSFVFVHTVAIQFLSSKHSSALYFRQPA